MLCSCMLCQHLNPAHPMTSLRKADIPGPRLQGSTVLQPPSPASPSGHSSRMKEPSSGLTALSISRLLQAKRRHAAAAKGCSTDEGPFTHTPTRGVLYTCGREQTPPQHAVEGSLDQGLPRGLMCAGCVGQCKSGLHSRHTWLRSADGCDCGARRAQ